jgi:hypothetical protein
MSAADLPPELKSGKFEYPYSVIPHGGRQPDAAFDPALNAAPSNRTAAGPAGVMTAE